MPQPTLGAADPRIPASIDSWKRKLLDLTKRNRALNFRATKVSTIAVVDEQPAEVFRQLVLRDEPMRFKAARGRSAATAQETDEDGEAFERDHQFEMSSEAFAPYDRATLGEHHRDEWLQTALAPDSLDRSLRRLDEQARSALDEQGVNTLFLALGMLHYVESRDSEQLLRAPIVLVPVELSRKSARTGYQLCVTDDEPIVNPALSEYLRVSFGVTLPELPDTSAVDEAQKDAYDLQTYFASIVDLIAGKKGWSLKTDIVLALFSFQKFVMYKDLDANGQSFAVHPRIRQLVTRLGTTGGHVTGLPDDVRRMSLDAEYPPERTSQVVDADSSQLRAIAAAARQHDIVIEGPPGTGKSQTITNLIAQALGAGKSVLFVAEKMAALSVVHSRLVQAGLGEFCLELHSTKANKRAVVRSIAAALDASLQNVAGTVRASERLPQVRATLTEYAGAVHEPHGTLDASPYAAYGELGRVLGAPRITYTGPVDTLTRDQLEATVRDLEDLAAAATPIGVPNQHPWRDSTRTFYTADDLDAIRETATALARQVTDVTQRASAVEQGLHLPPVQTFADVDTAVAVAEVLHRSPGAPLAVLGSDVWNAAPPDALRLIEQGRAVVVLRDRVLSRVRADALGHDHADDASYVERKSQGFLSFLAFLDGRYRAIKKRWVAHRQPGFEGSLADQVDVMRQVDRLRTERSALAAAGTNAQSLFGGLWRGEESDWAVLGNYVRWVVEFRGMCLRHGLSGRAAEAASRGAPDISLVYGLRDSAQNALRLLEQLRAAVSWPASYLIDAPLAEIDKRATELAAGVLKGPAWAAFEAARGAVAGGAGTSLLGVAMAGGLSMNDLAPAFLRAFWLQWVTGVVRSRPVLERFSTLTHEQRVSEFRALDTAVFKENQAALVGHLRESVQRRLRGEDVEQGMSVLRPEFARQRGHAPLRRTLTRADAAVRAIKPCWMMSPLTVAQYVRGDAPSFDLVIFDEASQLPVEDAVGAVARGKQLVVVGDPKQLPPTNFFAASIGQAEVPRDEEGTPVYEDSESILEQFMGAGLPMSRLKWHYRSAHESLIHFSNVQFYDSELYTFPSVETSTASAGLQFHFVEGGVYEGKGLNRMEARRVTDEVVRFAKEQLARRARGEPVLSLGVGTFNMRQQLAIQDELEVRRRSDPSIEPFFDRGVSEPFFVKNLENIQGDERDVILLSVTYAKAADGRLRYNFGPINGENGWRRLNVLTTRARQRMIVFSSMRGDEINLAATTSRGAQLLREFLLYAEHGRLDSTTANAAADTESPFERDVLRELEQRGIRVVPQVGVAGYRIDLAVLDAAVPGRFICGIECDGVAYHSSETARDRDRLRQQVLELRGWTIIRVWSTDWFKDRAGQIERLLGLIEGARARAHKPLPVVAQVAPDIVAPPDDVQSPSLESAYMRPTAAAYVMTPGQNTREGDILTAPLGQLRTAVLRVIATEAPIHEDDLMTRIVGMWGTRAGSRIQARITEAVREAMRARQVRKRDAFYWGPHDEVTIRGRAGTGIAAERIPPEEYVAAVRAVLDGGHALPRNQLTTEVRAVFGFARTGALLDQAIGRAIDSLLASGEIGEVSAGIRARSAGSVSA